MHPCSLGVALDFARHAVAEFALFRNHKDSLLGPAYHFVVKNKISKLRI